jgi:hypothetical protein
VDFSCKSNQLHKVVLPGPLLHFDLKQANCINAHPIEDGFTLPPGLSASDVQFAYIGMELNAENKENQLTQYSTWITINGNEVGRLNEIPSGYYKFVIDPSYFIYSQAGLAYNRYVLNSDMNRGYTTHLSNARVVICLKNLTLYVCAENEDQAEEIAWSSKWIYKPSNRINVTILSPKEDAQLDLDQPVEIKVKVDGEQGGEKYCTVRGEIYGSSNRVIELAETAEDGIYKGVWNADTVGKFTIKISAGNCAAKGNASRNVSVQDNSGGQTEESSSPTPSNGSGITPIKPESKATKTCDDNLCLNKTIMPQNLDVSNMDAEEGNEINNSSCPTKGRLKKCEGNIYLAQLSALN